MPATPRPAASRLALLVPVGAALFTVAWLVLGAVSPGYVLFGRTIAPYSWISQPVSGLGLGVTGPWMNAAFVGCGILILVGTVSTAAAWRRRGRLATAAFALMVPMGAGMILCGLFTLESMMLHLLGFLLAVPLPATGFVLAGLALSRTSRGPAVSALAGGVIALILFGVFMATFDATGAGGNEGISGLIQRALITVVLATQAALVVGLSRANVRVGPDALPVR
ncbi:DUF998 domain-containing protein [Microbacterium sp. M3]|uniref:DUF998 domain-containing protein n=1 Tax=Microbacterium arthrosphaerae TaxID=792652 RepID=A0ABU4H1L2_9MICO|nr:MULTISPECIES: DUF998 domain-containing protein [Microbacterium]MDW4571789.1 DUF998 domain-containing protein [Microbacterium arthrosphaerae]MDW7605644.1 DUF998 domain-containing protein [Microbacterium sp. M3]